ncbi:MAG TPA: hypothetical protein EYP57_02270 [Thermodesulfobacteriaceae bacterium]|nr:hypothetical protein [Thermodesulfobacteriaceae bacterium]
MVSTLPETSDSARHAILRCLSSGHFPVLSGRPLSGGLASGRLIGGNLTCLAHLLCTDSEPPWGNAILLLEEHNEAPYRIDRMLTQLLQAGRLERLTGIAIGQICSEDSPDLINSLLKDRFKSLTFPVLTGLPVGHRPDNFPLLLGSEYILDCDAGLLLPA